MLEYAPVGIDNVRSDFSGRPFLMDLNYNFNLENADYAILDIPFKYQSDGTEYYLFSQYLQTFHERPIVSGLISRTPESSTLFIKNTLLTNIANNDFDINKQELQNFLIKNKIKYAIIHKLALSDYFINKAEKMLDFAQTTYENEKFIIKKIY